MSWSLLLHVIKDLVKPLFWLLGTGRGYGNAHSHPGKGEDKKRQEGAQSPSGEEGAGGKSVCQLTGPVFDKIHSYWQPHSLSTMFQKIQIKESEEKERAAGHSALENFYLF